VRLEAYVKGLRKGAARGRSVADILGDDGVEKDFLADVRGFAQARTRRRGFSRRRRT
jgi:hypothetical protein